MALSNKIFGAISRHKYVYAFITIPSKIDRDSYTKQTRIIDGKFSMTSIKSSIYYDYLQNIQSYEWFARVSADYSDYPGQQTNTQLPFTSSTYDEKSDAINNRWKFYFAKDSKEFQN